MLVVKKSLVILFESGSARPRPVTRSLSVKKFDLLLVSELFVSCCCPAEPFLRFMDIICITFSIT